jgi:flagellar protein FliL
MAGTTTENKPGGKPQDGGVPAPAPGGLRAWLPLILTLLLMPALAFVMTNFVLLPKLTVVMGRQINSGNDHADTTLNPGEESHEGGESGHASKPKIKFPLSKIVVNVSGSLGSRLLLCSVTLAGGSANFASVIEENQDMLRDLAASVLASKTISDLEKPEARNLIRAELISQFNSALGRGLVQEIYITELAIQ